MRASRNPELFRCIAALVFVCLTGGTVPAWAAQSVSPPVFSTPQEAMEAVALAVEKRSQKLEFAIPVNMVSLCDIWVNEKGLRDPSKLNFRLRTLSGSPNIDWTASNFCQNQLYTGARSSSVATSFRDDYVGYPWEAAALRAVRLKTVSGQSAIAEVTNAKGQSTWLILRASASKSWRVTSIAQTKEQADLYAKESFWQAYIKAKSLQITEQIKNHDSLVYHVREQYAAVSQRASDLKVRTTFTGELVIDFTLTLDNQTDLVVTYLNSSLDVTGPDGKSLISASFAMDYKDDPIKPRSSKAQVCKIVYKKHSSNLTLLEEGLARIFLGINTGGNERESQQRHKEKYQKAQSGEADVAVNLTLLHGLDATGKKVYISQMENSVPFECKPDLYEDYEFKTLRHSIVNDTTASAPASSRKGGLETCFERLKRYGDKG